MLKRKRIVAIISMLSMVTVFLVGCSNDNMKNTASDFSVKEMKIKDVADAYNGEDILLDRYQYVRNEEVIDKHGKLELKSYEFKGYNEKESVYEIDVVIKNKSKDKLENVLFKLSLIGNFGGSSTEMYEIENIDAEKQITKRVKIKSEVIEEILIDSQSEENILVEDALSKAIEEKSIKGQFMYTYKNAIDEDMVIHDVLDFDGKRTDYYIEIIEDINEDDFVASKTLHKDNGSYLNIVNTEEKMYFDDIYVKNIELKITDDLDFEIITKFKNEGDKDITSFYYNPDLSVLGRSLYILDEEELDDLNTYYDKTIKAGEEFEIKTVIKSSWIDLNSEIIDMLKAVDGFDIDSKKPIVMSIVENRLISLNHSYSYMSGENTINSTLAEYTNNGKLSVLNVNQYDYNYYQEIYDL